MRRTTHFRRRDIWRQIGAIIESSLSCLTDPVKRAVSQYTHNYAQHNNRKQQLSLVQITNNGKFKQ